MSKANETLTLTIAEAAAWLGITTSQVHTMLRTDTFPARTFRLGSRTFIIRDDLERYVAALVAQQEMAARQDEPARITTPLAVPLVLDALPQHPPPVEPVADYTAALATIDMAIAARLLGMTTARAYELSRTDRLPVPVVLIAGQKRIPRAQLAAHLGITLRELDERVRPDEAAKAERTDLRQRARALKTGTGLLAYIDRLEARILALEQTPTEVTERRSRKRPKAEV